MSKLRADATEEALPHERYSQTKLERRDLFPMPLFSARVPDATALNLALRESALHWERSDPGVTVTNRDAYHSSQTLMASSDPALVRLRDAIFAAYGEVRRLVHRLETPPGWQPALLEGWFNIGRPGSHYISHNHLGQGWHWSGVYYVSSGGAKAGGGRIVFECKSWDYNLGPRPISWLPHTGHPGASEACLDPTEGELIFFPSSLCHRVEPFSSPGERISIAFNIQDPQLTWTFPSPGAQRVGFQHWLRHYFLGLYLPLKKMKDFAFRGRG